MNRLLPDEIKTERLRLRAPQLADAAVIFRTYAQDPRVCQYMTWVPHDSEAITQAFLSSCVEAWRVGDVLAYILTRHDSDEPIGMLEARILGTKIDIGYVLGRPHWGTGLMPEAIGALTRTALSCAGIYRVQASCDVDNVSSQRALEKSGFLREGRLERYQIHPNVSPEPRPCFLYARCR